MLKAQQSSSKLMPKYLFQANIENKLTYFFISYSYEKIWVKQPSTEWEEINVFDADAIRGGETTFFLSENKYKFTKLFTGDSGLNQPHFKTLPFIEGKTSSGNYTNEDLDEILISKQKLDGLGMTQHLELDLTGIDEKTTHEQEMAYNQKLVALKEKVRTQHSKKKTDWFDDILAKGERLIQENDSKRSRRSRLGAHASIFCEPSTAASYSEPKQESSEKLTEKVSQLTL